MIKCKDCRFGGLKVLLDNESAPCLRLDILRHLLNVNKEPIDFSRPAQSKRMDIIRQDCRDIWEKLRDAGIEMRPVFWSNEDKKNYKKAALLD